MKCQALLFSLLLPLSAAAAEVDQPYLLVPGQFGAEVEALDFENEKLSVNRLPDDQWFKLEIGKESTLLSEAGSTKQKSLPFLKRKQSEQGLMLTEVTGPEQTYYLRIPRAALKSGPVTEVPLKRRKLTPVPNIPYSLELAGQSFELIYKRSFQGKDVSHFIVETSVKNYEYVLERKHGYDAQILFAGDIDRDGLPDFIIESPAAERTGLVYSLLLSSLSKPGRNPPAARIGMWGC